MLIHSKGNSLHLFTPSSQSIPLPPPPPWHHKSIFTCTRRIIAALFAIAKTRKQSKCPLADDWIRKMWYIYTREYYSAIKKEKIVPFAATWMKLEILILNEISQKEKDKYHMISLISGI